MAKGKRRPVVREVPVTWIGAEDVPVMFVNNVLGQVDDRGDAILTFGQTTPPALVGTTEEVLAQAERLAYVPVKPIARFSMSRPRLLELRLALDQMLKIQEGVRAALRQTGQGGTL